MKPTIKLNQVWRRYSVPAKPTATVTLVGRVIIEIEAQDGKVFAWKQDRFLREWELVNEVGE